MRIRITLPVSNGHRYFMPFSFVLWISVKNIWNPHIILSYLPVSLFGVVLVVAKAYLALSHRTTSSICGPSKTRPGTESPKTASEERPGQKPRTKRTPINRNGIREYDEGGETKRKPRPRKKTGELVDHKGRNLKPRRVREKAEKQEEKKKETKRREPTNQSARMGRETEGRQKPGD